VSGILGYLSTHAL